MTIPSPQDFLNGVTLLVDKPKGWTSFDVVNKIRFALRRYTGDKKIKVGHAGTLDPMATGLLVICTGKSTKLLHEYQGFSKVYTGTILLGATTPSYDLETEIDARFPTEHLTQALLETARQQFLGEIAQLPPMYSAIKVDGQALYKKARKGESIELQPRQIRIDAFDLTRIELPEVDFYVACSKGTYIRSLAYDFGKALQSGGCLSALRRTQIGEFKVDDAWQVADFVSAVSVPPNSSSVEKE
ncbi:MAG: tRNA pseudouridine(55) synthase TruB [Saprospiraceae bacterium]